MRRRVSQLQVLQEDPHDPHPAGPASPCGRLWAILSRPLLRHWAVYDGLMALFLALVITLLLDDFM